MMSLHSSLQFQQIQLLKIIIGLLEKDEKLQGRTVLSVQNITDLLEFCLHNTYFSFQNKFYEQVEGVAMGSLVSPIVANLYMEHFEREVIQQRVHKQEFLEHINSIDPAIKLTV